MTEQQARLIVRQRSNGLCEVQVQCAGSRAAEWHHRVNRSQGGVWSPSNGLDACSACHSWITHNPAAAGVLGLHLHPSKDPAAVPVRSPLFGVPVLYDDEGCMRFAA